MKSRTSIYKEYFEVYRTIEARSCKKFMFSKISSESVSSMFSGERASFTIHLPGLLVLFNCPHNISDILRSNEISDDLDNV